MKQCRFVLPSCMVFAFALLVALTQTGCEEAKGIGGLQVDPESPTLATNETTVVLSVIGGITNNMLSMPLTWEVGNAGLGEIVASSGMTAVYRRSRANGVNTVTVRDQFQREGYVTIDQRGASYNFRLEADATTIQSNQGTTIRIEGLEAEAPFSWRLVSGPGSLSGDRGSRSASYAASSSTGVAQISVTDANGVSASIAITIQEPGSGSDGDPGDGGGPGSG